MSSQEREKLRLTVAVAAAGLINRDEATEDGVRRLLEGLETERRETIESKRAPLCETVERDASDTSVVPHSTEASVALTLHMLAQETPAKAQSFLKRLPQYKLFVSFPSTMRSILCAIQLKTPDIQRLDVLMAVTKALSAEYDVHVVGDVQDGVDVERKYNMTGTSMRGLYIEVLTLLKKMKVSVDGVDVDVDVDTFIRLSILTGFVLRVGVQLPYCRSLVNDIVTTVLEIVEDIISADKVEHVIAASFLINGLTETLNTSGHIRHERVSSMVRRMLDTPDTGTDTYLVLVPKLWCLIHDRFIYSSLVIPKTRVSYNDNDNSNNSNNSPLSNSPTQQSLALH